MKFIKNNLRIIIVIIFCLLCIFMIIKNNKDDKKLEKNHRFTIATITDIRGADGGPLADIKYSINGKLYKGYLAIGTDGDKIKVNKRIYLKYYTEDPNIGETLLDPPVNDSIKEAPVNGWDKLPRSSEAVK